MRRLHNGVRVPAANGTDNVLARDVIGNRDDVKTCSGSIVAMLKENNCRQNNEKVYPYDSEGVVLTPGNSAWGSTTVLIAPGSIYTDYVWSGSGTAVDFSVLGVLWSPTAGAGRGVTVQVCRIVGATVETLSGDSGVSHGDKRTVLVADTSNYAVGDVIWIKDDDTANGELGTIATITANTSLNLAADMVGDYTTAQNAACYLARRATNGYRSFYIKVRAGTLKDEITTRFSRTRRLLAADGLLMRGYGLTDASPVGDVSVIYDDE